MENFPSNAREPRTPPKPKAAEEKKVVTKVVTGEAIQQKPSFFKRLRETFVGDSGESVVNYVVFSVVIPAARDMVADAVTQGVERLIFGEDRASTRRRGYRPPATSRYTNYSSYTERGNRPLGRAMEREERVPVRHMRENAATSDILLATKVEADTVLDHMFDLLEKYDHVTVGDLHDLVGLTSQYTDQNWGWKSLRGSGASRTRDGWILDLPNPIPID